LVSIGAVLLIVAAIIALIGMFRGTGDVGPARHRESTFEE
jgi:hypothetical protein